MPNISNLSRPLVCEYSMDINDQVTNLSDVSLFLKCYLKRTKHHYWDQFKEEPTMI